VRGGGVGSSQSIRCALTVGVVSLRGGLADVLCVLRAVCTSFLGFVSHLIAPIYLI
jgi:hypothetical protein